MPPPTQASQQRIEAAAIAAANSALATTVGLIRAATTHDAEARTAAAIAAAGRIARGQELEAVLANAVLEARGASDDADAASRQLAAGDVARATATLTAAQGRFAAAIGTAAVVPGSALLSQAIDGAKNHLRAATDGLNAATPPGVSPPPAPPAGLPDDSALLLAALGMDCTGWSRLGVAARETALLRAGAPAATVALRRASLDGYCPTAPTLPSGGALPYVVAGGAASVALVLWLLGRRATAAPPTRG